MVTGATSEEDLTDTCSEFGVIKRTCGRPGLTLHLRRGPTARGGSCFNGLVQARHADRRRGALRVRRRRLTAARPAWPRGWVQQPKTTPYLVTFTVDMKPGPLRVASSSTVPMWETARSLAWCSPSAISSGTHSLLGPGAQSRVGRVRAARGRNGRPWRDRLGTTGVAFAPQPCPPAASSATW